MKQFNLAALILAVASTASAQTDGTMPVMGHTGTSDRAAPMGDAATYEVEALTIAGAFSRATLPNAPVAGGFLTVTNGGVQDDVLISASTSVAGMTQIHEMAMDGDVMRMRQLPDGLPIPAGQTVTLQPGGFHLMFMDLQQPLVEGDTVAVKLTFQHAGEVEIMLAVGAPNAKAAY